MNQGLQRPQLVCRSEVGMPGGHSDRLVSHEFLHCFQVYPSHHRTTSEGVPDRVHNALVMPVFVQKKAPAKAMVYRSPCVAGHLLAGACDPIREAITSQANRRATELAGLCLIAQKVTLHRRLLFAKPCILFFDTDMG